MMYLPEKYLPEPTKLESQSRLGGSLESVVMGHPAPKTYVARLQYGQTWLTLPVSQAL
jgi:hypothetical protein